MVGIAYRPVQRCEAGLIAGVDVGAVRDKQGDNAHMSPVGGVMKGGSSVGNFRIDVGPHRNEFFGQGFASVKRRPVQCCVALRSSFVNIRTAIDEVDDARGITGFGGIQ